MTVIGQPSLNKNYSTLAIKVEISFVYVSFFNCIINLDSTMVKNY